MAAVEVLPIEGVEEWFQVFEKSDSKCYGKELSKDSFMCLIY